MASAESAEWSQGYRKAFGMNVWVWARSGSRERAWSDGYTVAPSKRRSSECDVISLHMRLVDATRGIVTAAERLGLSSKDAGPRL